ncbi:MAG: hypothetical protein JSS20_22485, partial [Proteobacteria bacterium]|nr:hypothetical protein [Pseudomonadota bacterium]
MSMSTVREVVIDRLGSKGSLVAATMQNVNGGRQQTLTLTITKADGSTVVISETVPASTDLIAKAAAMA